MNFFTQQGRALLLAMLVVVALVGTAMAQTGTLTDTRDGQKYKTVKMPDGKTWMGENLRFNIGDSWCYGDKAENCEKYGRLYDWEMAKMACPKGWHLPSNEEWKKLTTLVGSKTGGKKLKSTSGWDDYNGKSGNGTDDYRFSALPGGVRNGGFDTFENAGGVGSWWTATGATPEYVTGYGATIVIDKTFMRYLSHGSDEVYEDKINSKFGLSVRCVQN
jgi:uncharacterized protein (TIGR02145 family)